MYLSPEFAGAFIALFAIYWSLQRRLAWSNRLLLLFSCGFYASFGLAMAGYMLAYSVVVHLLAKTICDSSPKYRSGWLTIGLSVLVLNLLAFKYYQPLCNQLSALPIADALWWRGLLTLDVVMPLGLSFISFQAIALLLDCHRQASHCQKLTLAQTATYLLFFPTVIAGPICRPALILLQLRLPRRLIDPAKGLAWIAMGLFKKLVIANWLATVWVDPMFDNPEAFNGLELMLGAAAYSIQIYADFSGLIDIVRGLAWLLGFNLPENFRRPYLAANPREFWLRWHISLSSWIRDFIYIPLGGSRHGTLRTHLNLLLAMLASGIWHGAGWNYLVWGALHGLACSWSRIWQIALPRPLSVLLTFTFVTFAWIFFRAADLVSAQAYLQAMFSYSQPFSYNLPGGFCLLLLFFVFHAAAERWPDWHARLLQALHSPTRLAAMLVFAWFCIELGPSGIPAFIYAKY